MFGSMCPKCATIRMVFHPEGSEMVTCSSCGFKFREGLTPEIYNEEKRQEKRILRMLSNVRTKKNVPKKRPDVIGQRKTLFFAQLNTLSSLNRNGILGG